MKRTVIGGTMKRTVIVAAAALALAGCDRPPAETVRVRVIEARPRLAQPRYLVEKGEHVLLESERGYRYLVAGRLGEPGDQFLYMLQADGWYQVPPCSREPAAP